MSFQHPWYLVTLPVVFLLLGGLARRNRQWIAVASRDQFVPAGLLSRRFIDMPLLCWYLVAVLLVVALADPRTARVSTSLKVIAKEAMVSVDASFSMGEGGEGSTMNLVRGMLGDFVDRRVGKGDFIGVSAYSGSSNSSRGYGYARVIQYPTRSREIAGAAIEALEPSLFGPYSAIGDGILVSILALIEPTARRVLGSRYDPGKLEDDLWSVGGSDENVRYAVELAEAVGEQRGRYLVLFTDGKFNTGLHPAAALWFAERLRLRVHFIAFESSAATGLSREEQWRRKSMIIDSVERTGGLYRESTDVSGVAAILKEIDLAEKTDVEVERETEMESRKGFFSLCAALVFAVWSLCWFAWSDPL